jgi:hypothetical protein
MTISWVEARPGVQMSVQVKMTMTSKMKLKEITLGLSILYLLEAKRKKLMIQTLRRGKKMLKQKNLGLTMMLK